MFHVVLHKARFFRTGLITADRFGAPNTIAIGGAACIAGSLVFWRKLPELRRLTRSVYVRLGILQEIAEE